MATQNSYVSISIFLLFIITISINAQSPPTDQIPNNTNNNGGNSFSSYFGASNTIIIILLFSSLLFLAFFSLYIRNCRNNRNVDFAPAAAASTHFIQFQHGLNPELLETFPTMMYAQVKPHKMENCALECAVCLIEFDDEDLIRLLPACNHVFHQDCVDAWLDTHVTCPVCRYDYNLYSTPQLEQPRLPDEITMDDVERRKEEMRELAILARKVRRSGRKSRRLSRCYSTGHLMVADGERSFDRYTLRLPENLRKEIVAAGSMRKARTFVLPGNVGGGGGEGSSRRGRTIYLGRSDRWPTFFARSLSARISSFGNGR